MYSKAKISSVHNLYWKKGDETSSENSELDQFCFLQ